MPEIWKDIKDYEDSYEVSNYGRIRSKDKVVKCKGDKTRNVKGKLRKTYPNKNGYITVVLSRFNQLKTFTVHQLVAQAFIPDFIKGTEINHKDGDPSNNAIDNLEESNPSHNQFHAWAIGLNSRKNTSSVYRGVTFITNPRAKAKWAGYITHQGKSTFGWKTFMSEEEAARHVDALLNSIGDTQRIRNFP